MSAPLGPPVVPQDAAPRGTVGDCPPLAAPPVLATASARRDPTARVVPWPVAAGAWAALTVLTLLALVPALEDPLSTTVLGRGLDVAVAVAALATAPLLLTRRAVPAARVLAGLAAVSGAATPASTLSTLHVARWSALRTALPVALAGAAGHAVQALWRPVALPLGWWLLCVLAVHAALLGWGAYGQARADLVQSLRERARRAESEQEHRVAEARLAERARIAREMHDTLAHRLSLLAATAGALEYRPDASPERLAAAAALVREGVSTALEELRDVVRVLRAVPDDARGATPLGPQPGLGDVPRLVAEARAAGGDVTLDRTGDAEPPSAVAVAAYRTVQEGLTNARRHAPGSPVVVRLTVAPGEVRVVVSDAGPRLVPSGAPAAGGGAGTGLVGLRERVALLGGRLDAGAGRGGAEGFVLDVRLPWDA
ncbi:sensor histidine kinase [Cellulosimicrobium sp. NPDC057127]|uniref:sensor histidine kinase n=1 Tax=Cellulosimicrobium sp. NPDC057127 TaxID=3346026 RepID=UPI00363DBE37